MEMQKGQKIEDKTCTKLGSGVPGAQMETHSSFITSFLLLFFYFASFSLFFKTLLLFSLKPYLFSIL
jgi:hypothetical protein